MARGGAGILTMVELHKRKKIEVIIETPARPLLIDVLNRAGSPGYTLIPAIGGRGLHSAWDRNQLMDAANQVIIVTIVSEEAAATIMTEVGTLLEDYRGVVTLSDVQVLRGGRF